MMWKSVTAAPPDAIFGLSEAFKKDPNPRKVNLGIGVYLADDGTTPILTCVKDAERILLDRERTKSYLPISGDPEYGDCVRRLILGGDHEAASANRAVTAHTPGGTGALRVGAELLKAFRPKSTVWISSPTWANHTGIFSAAGFELREYPYYDTAGGGLLFEPLLTTLEQVPAGDIVLLHACCHNPSGVDPDGDQWREIAAIAENRGWLPFLDFAYQGFAEDVDRDRIAVETFAAAGIDMLVASSFSKNFGLYNERTGALSVIAPTASEAAVAFGHLKKTVRVCYSNPPAHGGLVARTILSEPALEESWRRELAAMRERIVTMRKALVNGLEARGVEQDFSPIVRQRGMFSFSGLDADAVTWLRENRSVYVVGGGRINLAGLTSTNLDYVCDAIADALKR